MNPERNEADSHGVIITVHGRAATVHRPDRPAYGVADRPTGDRPSGSAMAVRNLGA